MTNKEFVIMLKFIGTVTLSAMLLIGAIKFYEPQINKLFPPITFKLYNG